MSQIKNLIAGLAGSIALNLLHETLRSTQSNVPRIDLLGEEALQKTLNYFGTSIGRKEPLYSATLAGDLIGNSIYYSMIGAGKPKYLWSRAIFVGLSAGIGAVKLPEPMGLNPKPVARNKQVEVMTVGYYLFGALVTGMVLKMLK